MQLVLVYIACEGSGFISFSEQLRSNSASSLKGRLLTTVSCSRVTISISTVVVCSSVVVGLGVIRISGWLLFLCLTFLSCGFGLGHRLIRLLSLGLRLGLCFSDNRVLSGSGFGHSGLHHSVVVTTFATVFE